METQFGDDLSEEETLDWELKDKGPVLQRAREKVAPMKEAVSTKALRS